MSRTRLLLSASVMVLSILALCCKPVHAASNGTLDVTIQHAPRNLKAELFQVGAPYPSRQNTSATVMWYDPFTCGLTWFNLVTTQSYFVRVTDRNTGRARQTFAFRLAYDYAGVIVVDWTAPNFVRYVRHLN